MPIGPAQGNPGSAVPESGGENILTTEDLAAHFQATIVDQFHEKFNSPYNGTNSLLSKSENKPSLTTTLFVGKRLWEGGELYLNPEVAGGYALSSALGMGGFPNGEVTRVAGGDPVPALYLARGFFRQTWSLGGGLGGEKERIESDQNVLAGHVPVSRFTITAGKMAALDIFDNNAYAHDPRTQFLNWALFANGAWDYPADTRGYTNGIAAELNQSDWALRYGIFMEPRTPNGMNLDWRVAKAHGQVVEGEIRYSPLDQPGKLRLLGFINNARMGNYRDTINNPLLNMDQGPTRRDTLKYGTGLNMEQSFGSYFGGFLRAGWNNGATETWAFTEIDQTFSLGTVVKGTLWGRPEDKIGVAGVINGLSKDHRDFLARGGTGFIIGDGALNYAMERIVETYYSVPVPIPGMTFTLNYQHVDNPAYNADRGPVSIYSFRLHFQM